MARIIDSNHKNLIGKKVRILRKEKNMSQQELSAKLETLAIYICRGSISTLSLNSKLQSRILQHLQIQLPTYLPYLMHPRSIPMP